MKSVIFSVFPACGKTWLFKNQKKFGLKILDSDSSEFSWIKIIDEDYRQRNCNNPDYMPKYIKERNPDFPNNYINHIKENIGKYDYIFVSSHDVVRNALDEEGISFVIVYPSIDLKFECIGRCFVREQNGENGCTAKVMNDNYDKWIKECIFVSETHPHIVLGHNEYLSDYLMKNDTRYNYMMRNWGIE